MKKLLFLSLLAVLFTGQAFAAHSVALTCTASASTGVTGYNFYRGTAAGAENATPLNASPVAACAYTDNAVTPGQTYFYIAKAFCPTCSPSLSVPSNEASGTVPLDAQPLPPTGVTLTAQ